MTGDWEEVDPSDLWLSLAVTEDQVPQQHIVSKVLIKRWTSEGRVLAVDLDHPHAQPKLKAPAAIGYKIYFIRAASKQWEDRWRTVENLAPGVFAAVDDRSIFDQPALVDALKDLIAIHFARSHVADLAWRASLRSPAMAEREAEIADILRMDGALDELFGHYTGLTPPGTPESRQIALDRFARDFEARVGEGGLAFAEAVGEATDQMREILDRHSLDIGVAANGAEFVLSDTPVQTLDHSTRTVGILSGIALDRADTIVMPVGPKNVVAPGKQSTFTEMRPPAVSSTNAAMVASARRFVYARPGSGQDSWAREAARRLRQGPTSPRECRQP